MKCTNVKENLDALLDGETGNLPAAEIEKHLENCAFCRTEYKNLQAVGEIMRQNLRVSAPALLNKKVLNAFEAFHRQKTGETPETARTEKTGWFGIPRFAFATGLILFALLTISAFQLGRMSANEARNAPPVQKDNKIFEPAELAENNSTKDVPAPVIKTVEVPVIREKIVEVPVIREKIVIKTIYVNKKAGISSKTAATDNSAVLKNLVEDNSYLTQTDLRGFQPVADFKLKINKEEK